VISIVAERDELMVKIPYIRIKGTCEHNLKNINIDIPKNKLVVLTGISGSGKSSLAFDTIYAEGQRRYMESLSSYARQFMGPEGGELGGTLVVQGTPEEIAANKIHIQGNI